MVNFDKQFESILNKYKEIENSLNNQSNFDSEKLIKYNKEYAELKPIVQTINSYRTIKNDVENLKQLLEDNDIKIKQMAETILLQF